ncbi:MAG: hypothetical protein GKS06_02585 [Acidobacteria bacterium]|nr:hypothetical protein [Acidobacteriota bacterium]
MSDIPKLRTLDDFVGALRAEKGLPRKVRLLAHYWRQVRDLAPADRQRVALALGSQSAWKHLEKTFGADGHLTEGEMAVKRTLERIGKADPKELQIMADRMRSGDYHEVGSDLLVAMGEALDEEAAAKAPGNPEPEPDLEAEQAEPEIDAESERPRSEVTSEPSEESDEPGDEAPPAEESPEEDEEEELATEAVEESAPETIPELDDPAADERPDSRPENTELAAQLRAQVLGLQADWKRRRLIGALIRGREVELDAVLDLVELVESPSQRVWCLGDVIEQWPLTADQVEAVVAAAPNETTARRLRTRALVSN